ncbi:Elongation of very long chain fatty acids protein 1 [Nymphon striatum]|nr:Elongation of very long chain fatty acids protein 1 [Nymphon striatum]
MNFVNDNAVILWCKDFVASGDKFYKDERLMMCIPLIVMLGFAGWFHKVNYQCYPNDLARTPENNLMLNVIWYFWISKFVELLDTIYFVLRKKDRQVTVLHVYHHCTMIFNVWITIKLSPVGHFTFIGFTNSFVHFPMYAYYGLAAIGPHMQKYLGWKKYITTIQLVSNLTWK